MRMTVKLVIDQKSLNNNRQNQLFRACKNEHLNQTIVSTKTAATWFRSLLFKVFLIDHFTVVCLVARPLNESEAGGDFALTETSPLF